jgi:phosphatidylserine/phosphatidylglycerophosphate/cardiolipin synthase-like enzyme
MYIADRKPRLVLIAILAFIFPIAPAYAQNPVQERLCDVAYQDCRKQILDLIDAEKQSIDVGFWFMEDSRYSSKLIRRFQAGVRVRVMFDSEALPNFPGRQQIMQDMATAGIPIRDKTSGGILHWKIMIFGGQNIVNISAANFSPSGYVPAVPYADYEDEVVFFTTTPSLVNSFKTKYDNVWTSTTGYTNWANVTTLQRYHPTYPIDPDLNFPPTQDYGARAVKRYDAELPGMAPRVGIDVDMYRVTDRRHSDAMIRAVQRGIPVRLYTEQEQYRNPNRLWHSWNVDRMYAAGVQVKQRAHEGLNHQKSVILHGQHMVIYGSSNWTTPSATEQLEHNYFTTQQWFYDYFVDQFERKWNNTGPVAETKPFVPLPPDTPKNVAPANAAVDRPLSITLKWYAGPWAHKYDIYFGTSSNPPRIASDLELGPSQYSRDYVTYTVPIALTESTTYYWKIVGKTMAWDATLRPNLSKTGQVWNFRTQGSAGLPGAGPQDVVLYASKASVRVGNWTVTADATAAGGSRLWNHNANAAKLTAPLANPSNYFEMSFQAEAGVAYRLWLRGKAEGNSYTNDSAYVQFSDSVTSTGTPTWRIGTTSGTTVSIEDCNACGLSNWGWADNGYGTLGALVYFGTSGAHTIRIQQREDGLSLDQIMLSRDKFITDRPGEAKDDGTIYAESGGLVASIRPLSATEIVLRTADAMMVQGKRSLTAHSSTASVTRIATVDADTTKISTAVANRDDPFELTSSAVTGVGYQGRLCGKAQNNISLQQFGTRAVLRQPRRERRSDFPLRNGEHPVSPRDDTGASLSRWG